jgi:hypothetical protein
MEILPRFKIQYPMKNQDEGRQSNAPKQYQLVIIANIYPHHVGI